MLVVAWPPPRPLGGGTTVIWSFDSLGSEVGESEDDLGVTAAPVGSNRQRRRRQGQRRPFARARATAAVGQSTPCMQWWPPSASATRRLLARHWPT